MSPNATQPTNPWDLARGRFLEEEREFLRDLSPSERMLYKDASLETILHQANDSYQKFNQTDMLNRLRQRLKPLVNALDGYGTGLDVISGVSEASVFMAPIWGSMRVVLNMAQQTYEFFEKLIDMLLRIENSLPQFRDYERLFSRHDRLLLRLSDAYLNIVRFCKEVKCLFKTAKGRKVSKLSFTLSCKSLWPPFAEKFAHFLEEFQQHHKQIILEVDISHMTEAKKERILQENARALIARNRRESKLRQALDKMSSVNYQIQHEKLRQARCAGTATWIFDNDNFQRWFAQAGSALLGIFGIPGSGKSILTSQVIDELSPSYDQEASLCYYYCDYADRRTLSAYVILATILRQWLGHPIARKVGLQDWIIDQFHEQQFRPPIKDLISKVLEVLAASTAVCLVLDGLDELDDNEQSVIGTIMARLLRSKNCQIKLIVSCRGESMQRKRFWYSGYFVTMSPSLSGDMQVFVEHAVEKKIQDEELSLDNALLKQEIVAKLAHGAKDMFLWAHFQIAELCEAKSEDEIRRTLETLPRDLSKTYLRIVTRISGSKTTFCKERVEFIICWLMCARRPLTIEELSEAVAIREDDTCLVRNRIVQDGKQLLQDCGNLVIIDPEDGTVKFAHHTVREFFIGRHWEPSVIVNAIDQDEDRNRNILSDANSRVGRLCLQYLHFSDFHSQVTSRPSEPKAVIPLSEGFIEAVVPLRLSPIAKAVTDCFVQPTHGTREINLKFLRKREHNPLEQKYHMLDYVTSSWPYHFHLPEVQFRNDLAAMAHRIAFEKQFTFRSRPWDISKYTELSPTHYPSLKKGPPPPAPAAFRWSIDEGVASVLRMILQYHHKGLAEYIRFESQSTLPNREVLRRVALSFCKTNLRQVAGAIKEQRWTVPLEEINSLLLSKQPQAFCQAVSSMQRCGVSIGYGGLSSSIWSNVARSPHWYGQKWKYSTTNYSRIFPLLISEAMKMDDVIYVEILTSLGAVPKHLQIHQAAFNGQDELLPALCKAFVSTNAVERESNVLYLRELREDLYMQRRIVQGNSLTPFCEMLKISNELDGRQVTRAEISEGETREAENLQQMRVEGPRDPIMAKKEWDEQQENEQRESVQKDREREETEREQEGHVGWKDQIVDLAEDEWRDPIWREEGERAQEDRERGERAQDQEVRQRMEEGQKDRSRVSNAKDMSSYLPDQGSMHQSQSPGVGAQRSELTLSRHLGKDDCGHINTAVRRWSWNWKNEAYHHDNLPRTNRGRENAPKFLDIQQSTVVINTNVLVFVSVCSCGFLVLILNVLVLVLSISLGIFPPSRALPLSQEDEGRCREE